MVQNLGNGDSLYYFPYFNVCLIFFIYIITKQNKNPHSTITIVSNILCRILRFISQNSDFVCLGMGPDSIFTQFSSESNTIYRLISENYTYTTVPQIFKYIPNLKGKSLSSLIPPLQAFLYSYLLISYPFPETINSMKAEPVFVFIHLGVPSAYQSAYEIKFCWMNKWIDNSKEKKEELSAVRYFKINFRELSEIKFVSCQKSI